MNVGTRPGLGTILLATAFTLVALAGAQAADGIAGKWQTEADGPRGKEIQIVELTQDDIGRWVGTTRSSDAPDDVRDLEDLSVTGDRVTFGSTRSMGGSVLKLLFDLRLRPIEDALAGTVEVSGPGFERAMPVEFKRVVKRESADGVAFDRSRPVLGSWSGRPDDKDKEREIQFDILPEADGYKGTITDTGADATVAMRDLDVKDGNVVSFNFRFEDSPFMSSYWGRYDEARDEVRGTLSVGGRSQPLYLERTSEGPGDVEDEFGTRKEPLPIKHPGRLAATARIAAWRPLFVIKEKNFNINDVTSMGWAFDGGIRFHLVDYLAVQARYARGGLGFDTEDRYLSRFDPTSDGPQSDGMSAPLTTDSYLSLDGFEFSLIGFLGQNILPDSKFNPYLIGLIGRTTWELTEDGRGSNVIEIFEVPVEGSDWTFGGGLGTEYAVNRRFGLELEWLWSYTTTSDELKWTDTTYQWTSQHVYRFSLGGIFWF